MINRINYRTLRRITFAVYILITILFCAVLVYIGKQEISKAKAYAENERLYVDSLLECNSSFSLLENSIQPILAEPSKTACSTFRDQVLVFHKTINRLARIESERAARPSVPVSELQHETQLLCSVSEAVCADMEYYRFDKQTVSDDVSQIINSLKIIQSKLQFMLRIEMDHAEIWQRQSLFFFGNLQYLLVLFFVLTTVFSLSASFFFGHILRKSLKDLSEGTRQISSGNLKYRFKKIQSDEIGDVMHDFNLMAKRLEQQKLALEKINRELGEKATQLIEAHKHKDRFLANMSHELRTPLSSIIGFSELIIRKSESPQGDPKILAQSQRILAAAEHLLDLISDLLEVAKLDAGVLKPSFSEINLSESATNVLLMLKPLAEQKGIALNSNIQENMFVSGDERLIRQIMINLVNNAIKFTHHGNVSVTAHFENMAEYPSAQGQIAVIEVADTGIGISTDDQKRLFKDFHRAETGLTSNYEGVGLGLTLCKRFVELHNGNINVKSEPGKGSVFTVTLPCKRG